MTVELKNVKVVEALSYYSRAYSATLYFDGQRRGRVWNDGQGRPDRFDGDPEVYKMIDKWCEENLPKWYRRISGDTVEIPTGLSDRCLELVNECLEIRRLKRIMRYHILYVNKGEGVVTGVKATDWEKALSLVRQACPDAVVMNTLPFEEALELWRTYQPHEYGGEWYAENTETPER